MLRMTSIAAAPSLTVEPLWARTRASFARAVAAIGAPVAIAALGLLTRALRRAIVGRVARLEFLVRRLLLAEATAIGRSESTRAPAQKHTSAAQTPTRAAPRIDYARPETWQARFAFAAPRDPRAIPDSQAPSIRDLWGPTPPPAPPPVRRRPAHNEEESTFRLARRFEAVRRVLENPLPYARRLACLLTRAVRRFPEIVRRLVLTGARTNDYDRADPPLGIDILGACVDAPEAFPDSS